MPNYIEGAERVKLGLWAMPGAAPSQVRLPRFMARRKLETFGFDFNLVEKETHTDRSV
jgi:hypothetical protein